MFVALIRGYCFEAVKDPVKLYVPVVPGTFDAVMFAVAVPPVMTPDQLEVSVLVEPFRLSVISTFPLAIPPSITDPVKFSVI